MDDSAQFKDLQDLLSPVNDEALCGEDLDNNNDEEYMRIGRAIEQAEDSREWRKLKEDILKVLSTTKDFRLLSYFCRILLQTESSPIKAVVSSLYLTKEYIEKYWDCVYPPEDEEDPDEKYADRINAIAEFGSWPSVVLLLRKKRPTLSFNGMEPYFLEDLVAFHNNEIVADKQPVKDIFNALSPEEQNQIISAHDDFTTAHELALNIKELLLNKTQIAFIDFDDYLLPNLQEGVSVLSDLNPDIESTSSDTESNEKIGTSDDIQSNIEKTSVSQTPGSIQSRDDVIKLLDIICTYYEKNEPSSPVPLLLKRAKSIVHKDFLGLLEELLPDSVSMTETVFGQVENNTED